MAPLCYTAKFDPFLSLDCARVEGGGCGDQILPSGNLEEEERDALNKVPDKGDRVREKCVKVNGKASKSAQ